MSALPSGVTRVYVPLLNNDLITINDPQIIRRIAVMPEIGRPSETKLPVFIKAYFEATKFYSVHDKKWAVPMEGDNANHRQQRYNITSSQLEKGFSIEQLSKFDELVNSNKSIREVGAECAKLIAPLVLPLPPGDNLPDEVAYACTDTLTDLPQMLNPIRYLAARKARKLTEDYIKQLLPDEEYPVDYVHNLGAAAQGFAKSVLSLRNNSDDEAVKSFLTQHPMVDSILRVPIETTTLGGLLPEDNPAKPDNSLIIFKIGEASQKTSDPLFMFGAGVEHRQCPFRHLFFATAEGMANRAQ